MNPTIILAAGGVLAILLLWRGSAVGGSQSSAGGSAKTTSADPASELLIAATTTEATGAVDAQGRPATGTVIEPDGRVNVLRPVLYGVVGCDNDWQIAVADEQVNGTYSDPMPRSYWSAPDGKPPVGSDVKEMRSGRRPWWLPVRRADRSYRNRPEELPDVEGSPSASDAALYMDVKISACGGFVDGVGNGATVYVDAAESRNYGALSSTLGRLFISRQGWCVVDRQTNKVVEESRARRSVRYKGRVVQPNVDPWRVSPYLLWAGRGPKGEVLADAQSRPSSATIAYDGATGREDWCAPCYVHALLSKPYRAPRVAKPRANTSKVKLARGL